MSWTYSGDPKTSTKDETRFLLGDTIEAQPELQDEEIAFALIQKNNNAVTAAMLCCSVIMAKYAPDVRYKIGPEQVYANDRYTHYSALLASMQREYQLSVAAPFGDLPTTPNAFSVGMQDNHWPY